MNLYTWSSTYLENYANGLIAVLAKTEDEARAKARTTFETHLRETKDWLFLGLSNHEVLQDEDIAKERAKFEDDIARPPARVESGVLFIAGSE